MMYLGCAALLTTLVTAAPPSDDIARGLQVGATLSASSILGAAGRDLTLGYTFRPTIGYELSTGVAGFVALSYSRWNTGTGLEWQLAAMAGARLSLRRGRWLPWGELALGWGQLVNPQLATDVGVRSSGALGVDFLLADTVRAGVRASLERLDGGQPIHGIFWLDAGFVATFFF
ncbi:MAG TPA: hypothetical protein VHL80_04870 [Polyangia bacterium]|nr:hypothetical protein [Polyangia bacterium]